MNRCSNQCYIIKYTSPHCLFQQLCQLQFFCQHFRMFFRRSIVLTYPRMFLHSLADFVQLFRPVKDRKSVRDYFTVLGHITSIYGHKKTLYGNIRDRVFKRFSSSVSFTNFYPGLSLQSLIRLLSMRVLPSLRNTYNRNLIVISNEKLSCLLYTSPSPRDS